MKAAIKAKGTAAFTLVELLVVIGILSVLSSLVFTGLKQARKVAYRADGTARMRQIGLAVQSYATDNDGSLPGPLWSGQSPWYNSGDPRSLGTQLWSYLGAPPPESWTQEAKLLAPKAYLLARTNSSAPSFIVDVAVKINNTSVSPWGYQSAGSNTAVPPLRIPMLTEIGMTSIWALQDVDKTNPYVDASSSWLPSLPSKPIYDSVRLVLYFDWHVAAISSRDPQ